MSKRNHTLTTKLMLGFAILLIVYGGFWLYVSERILADLHAWRDEMRHEAINVDWQRASATGFPTILSIVVDKPTILDDQGNKWATDQIVLTMRPWDWSSAQFELAHDQFLAWADERFVLSSAEFTGTVSSINKTSWLADLTINESSLTSVDREILRLHTGQIQIETTPTQHRSAMIWFSLKQAHVPALDVSPLGTDIAFLSSEIELLGLAPAQLNRSELHSWREAGGVVETRSARLVYGPLRLHADGTLALDSSLQPVGAFNARIHGYSGAVDALVTVGTLKPDEAAATKFVLGALATKDSTTGEEAINLPISIQDQSLSVGPLEIMQLPTITWND